MTFDTRRFGFLVGRYFACVGGDVTRPDFVAIESHIRLANIHAVSLWRQGLVPFVPHNNTHHFEVKTKVGEPVYQAFDRRVLTKASYIFATPNWRESSGGRKEIALADSLGIPIFETTKDLLAWLANTGQYYSTVRIHNPPADDLTSDFDGMKLVLVDGPFIELPAVDVEVLHDRYRLAEAHAMTLWNSGVPCFAPQLNCGLLQTGYEPPVESYIELSDFMLEEVVDAMFVLPGFEAVPSIRSRVERAYQFGKPVFSIIDELLAWRDGQAKYVTLKLGR